MSHARAPFLVLPLFCAVSASGCGEEAFTRQEATPSLSIRLGGSGFQSPSALAADGPGLVVVGTFEGAFSHGAARLEGRGGLDGFVVGLTADGQPRFARAVAGADDDTVTDVAAAPGGGVVIGGQASRGSSPWPADTGEAPQGAAFLSKLRSDGEPEWTTTAGGRGFHAVTSVAVAADGAVYAVGDYSGRLRWGGESELASDGGGAFVLRLDARGQLDWLRPLAGKGIVRATGLVLRDDGSVVVAGTFTESLSAGGTEHRPNPDFSETPFLAQLDARGTTTWVRVDLAQAPPSARHANHGHAEGAPAHRAHHLEQVVVQPGLAGRVLVSISSSSPLAHEGLEAQPQGELVTMTVSAAGQIEERTALGSPSALVQIGAPFVSGGAAHLFASWTGKLMLPDGPLVSDGRRSLAFFEMGPGLHPRQVRWFRMEAAGLSARDVAVTDASLLVLGHWNDPSTGDADVFFATFPR